MRGPRGVAVALALLCLLAGCDDETSEPREHPSQGGSWTVLVYMVADNNLEPAALDDIIEMADVGSARNLNIVVQIDRAQGYDENGLGQLPNWTSTKRLRVMPGALEPVSDLGELNMGDPRTLSDFITWGVKTYPADRYALVFWDHGGAWPGFGGDSSTQDDDLLTLAELKSGIQAGMTAAGLQQFALIGYDACLMATYEVALAMEPFGEYLLASEELEPGHGWDYRSLKVLKQDPSTSPRVLGAGIIEGFKAQAVQAGTAQDITLSLTDLYALGDLKTAVEQLAQAYPAVSATSGTATAFGRGRAAVLKFGEMPNPAQSVNMVDLGDLAAQVAQQMSSASAVRSAVDAALTRAVVARTSGPRTSRATGLSIYFPPSREYYASAYAGLPEVETWRGFLTRFLQGGTSTVKPAFAGDTADAQATTTQVTFRGTLASGAQDTVTTAELYYGYAQSNGNLVVLGDRTAQLDTRGSPASVVAEWNYKALKLTQGTSSGFAYLSLEVEDDGQVSATMPFHYYERFGAAAQFAVRVLLLDASGNVTQDSYFLISEGGFGALFPVEGSVLQPLVQVYDAATDRSTFQVLSSGDARFDATKPIGISFERLLSGTQVFGILNIEDYSGEGDQVYNVVTTP
ncbi:clostripain-related cysteine peptidase [Myxococcaceae bacterium GXIMD 01537]